MRINRTFSIDYELVLALKKKVNQSETVNRAVRKYLDNSDAPEVSEESLTKTLMWICSQLYTKDQPVTEVAQIINARDVLMSFIQELTS
jgi:hypothetical protein